MLLLLTAPEMNSAGLGVFYLTHAQLQTLPNALPFHEFKSLRTEIRYECKTSPMTVDNGAIQVPTGPGSGVEIDPEFIVKFRNVTG